MFASIKSALEGRSILEATKGPTLLVLDDIDGFFSANPLFAQKLVDLITKKPGQNKKDGKGGNKDFKAPGSKMIVENDDDDDDNKNKLEDPRAEYSDQGNAEQSNTRQAGAINTDPSQAGLLAKRPVIFICDDAYSKGLKPLRTISHWFKLEKNSESLVERLKVICRHEVRLW